MVAGPGYLIPILVAALFFTAVTSASATTRSTRATPTAGETPEERANVEVVRRYFDELHTQGDLEVADAVVAPDAVFHIPGGELVGPEGITGLITVLRTAFPDAVFPIEDIAAEGDNVAVRWVMRGTHEGEFQGIAPTGEPVEMSGLAFLRLEDGKIVENWIEYDLYGLLQQIGAIPTPGTPAAVRLTVGPIVA